MKNGLGLLFLACALALFATVFFGCASVPLTSGAVPSSTAARSAKARMLDFEIVHQKSMGFPMIDPGWVDYRLGHVVNFRTIPVDVTIDCDVSYMTPVTVNAAKVGGDAGELWFWLRKEDQNCTVSRVLKN